MTATGSVRSLLHLEPPYTPGRFFFTQPLVFAVAATSALLLAALASWDGGSLLLHLDEPVAHWVADNRSSFAAGFFDNVNRLGDNLVVFPAAVILAAVTWRRCRILAVALLVAVAMRPMFEFVFKAVIGRDRPHIAPLGDFDGKSHPSGHPLAATSLWGLLPAVLAVHSHRRWLWWATTAVVLTVIPLVAASRVYRGAHWATDVTASLVWGGLYLLAVQGAFDRFHHGRHCRQAPVPAAT